MANCFVYGDYEGMWAILQKPWPEYLKHGYTWYCEITSDGKSGTICVIQNKHNADSIKASIHSLLNYFPGFTQFSISLPGQAPISVQEFLSQAHNGPIRSIVNLGQFTNKLL
jgi:hypothetical protein